MLHCHSVYGGTQAILYAGGEVVAEVQAGHLSGYKNARGVAHEGGYVGEERVDEGNEDGSREVEVEDADDEEVHEDVHEEGVHEVARTRKEKEAALGMREEDKTCLVWRTEVENCGMRDGVCQGGDVICSIR